MTPLQASPLSSTAKRILDFDIETLAAGFDDPQWVPQKITCIAWSWVDDRYLSDMVRVETCGDERGLYTRSDWRRNMLQDFLLAFNAADVVTGHNLLRFDLPILNAECLRLGLDPLKAIEVQDTMRISRTKGFKKGQDNLGTLLKSLNQKQSMNWQEWDDAYSEPGWPRVISRAESDVRMHKEIRVKMLENRWLKKNVVWRP